MTDSGETTTVETAADGSEKPREESDDDVDTSHLDGVKDGCGCAEVWEHLSDERED
jgi:hypothetical protein